MTERIKVAEWIKTELLTKAVENRCFCESGSREFIEFISAEVVKCSAVSGKEKTAVSGKSSVYKARLTVNFSGEPKVFYLLIKLAIDFTSGTDNSEYNKFLNEEMFYNKMIQKYNESGVSIFPKCYVADMGRYGMPVIVLEDLEADSSSCFRLPVVDDDEEKTTLDEDQLELAIRAIKRFHDFGASLATSNHHSLREFNAKLMKIQRSSNDQKLQANLLNRLRRILKEMCDNEDEGMSVEVERGNHNRTLCHGNLISPGRLFFRYENGKPIEVKIIGWNRIEYSSHLVDLADLLHDRISRGTNLHKYLRLYYYRN